MATIRRLAIRRGAGDAAFADGAASTRRVFDHDCLAKRLAHSLCHDARNHIGRTADAERHDHNDWPRRIPQAEAHTWRVVAKTLGLTASRPSRALS